MNNIGGEPAGGDFVAFLDSMERRQLRSIAAPHRPATPAGVQANVIASAGGAKRLSPRQAEAVADSLLAPRGGDLRTHRLNLPAFALAIFGIVLLAIGLGQDFDIVLMAMGGWMLFVAGKRLLRRNPD